MIEFFYYILSRKFPNIEPYDVETQTKNLFIKDLNIVLVFDNDTSRYDEVANVYLIHSKNEAPDTKYMNYYVNEISFDEALRVIGDIADSLTITDIKPLDARAIKEIYNRAINQCNAKYREATIEYMSCSEKHIYPKGKYKGLCLEKWFRMQADGYEIEYEYNGQKCKAVNTTLAWGDWGYYYTILRKYEAIYETNEIRSDAQIEGIKIGAWVIEQRTAYRKGYITAERVKLLNEAGISFNTFDDAWKEKYNLLVEYENEFGHVNIEKREKYRGEELGNWCQCQRDSFRKKSKRLTKERIEALDKIGFDWDPLETEWNRRYEQYKRYVEQNDGNPYISRRTDFEGEHLGAWVETQRKWFAQGKMSKERESKMRNVDSINYV